MFYESFYCRICFLEVWILPDTFGFKETVVLVLVDISLGFKRQFWFTMFSTRVFPSRCRREEGWKEDQGLSDQASS